MHRRQGALLAAVGAFVLLTWQAQVAQGATDPAASATGSARHCAAGLSAEPADVTTADLSSAEVTCFDTFAESVAFATGGRIDLAPETKSLDDAQLEKSGAVSTPEAQVARPLLGIEYQNTSYGGDSLVLYGSSGTGCYAGDWYGFPNLSSLGFNNKISSAKMYSNCLGKHHDGTSYTGSYIYCDSSCSSLGSMNDRTSSIKFI